MKRKRLYYVPGLISIIGLPALLTFYNPDEIVRPCAIKLFLPSEKKDSAGIVTFNTALVYRTISNKKITAIDLDDDRNDGDPEIVNFLLKRMLELTITEMEKLKFTHDTSRVLKIQLGENCTYGDFVWVLDKTVLYRVRRFAFADNAFYIFADPPPPPLSHDEIALLDLPFPKAVQYIPPSR